MNPTKIIRSVKISNFQSHKNTNIDFAGQGCLTVITGPSDSGKSAVIRALRWLFYNVPQGTDYITVGEDKCVVSVLLEGETVVERIRTRGGVNRYTVNGEVFEGFGTNVPLEVQQATGVRKLSIGDMTFMLNLSEQLDGPFLGKSVPGSARAKVLGKLAGTEEIDYAGKELGTDIYRAKRQQEGLEKDIESIHKAIDEYSWIEDKEAKLNRLQGFLDDVKRGQQNLAAAKEMLQKYCELSFLVEGLKSTIRRLELIELGFSVVENAQRRISQREEIAFLLTGLEKAREQICESELIIEQLSGIESAVNLVSSAKEKLNLGTLLCNHRGQYLQAYLQKESNQVKLRNLLEQLEAITPLLDKAVADSEKAELLDLLYQEHFQTNLAVTHYGRIIRGLSRTEEALDGIAQANSKVMKLQEFKKLKETYLGSLALQAMWDDKQAAADYDVTELEGHYVKLMTELGKCPTCGGEINVNKLMEVI